MSRPLVIAGDGEHARVVAEAAAASGWQPVGWIGPADAGAGSRGAAEATPRALDGTSWLPWLGTDEDFARQAAPADPDDRPRVVLGFGGPVTARQAVVRRLEPVAAWATVIHPAAWVSPSARLGPGSVVLAGAIINTGASVGAHAIVNSGAIVEHDVRLGDHVHVAPGAAIGGGAVIGTGTFVGLNAAVRDHVTVGESATVAMGAAVTGDVPPGATVLGVPARG